MLAKDPIPLVESPDAALQPFLEAARGSLTANISSIRAVVSKVLSHAEIFAGYDQLKAILLEPLQKAGPEGAKIVQTLDLFSYGTYADYVTRTASDPNCFIPLSESQIFKLRQLTVLTLVQMVCCGQQKSDRLSYATVQQALQLPDDSLRTVEQILISCLYAGVFSGQLCQKTKALLHIAAPMRSRDVPMDAIPVLLATLRGLQANVERARRNIARGQEAVQRDLRHDALFWKRQAEVLKSPQYNSNNPMSATDAWSTALIGHAGLMTAEVTSAAAAMDVTGRRQKRSRGGLGNSGGASAFQI